MSADDDGACDLVVGVGTGEEFDVSHRRCFDITIIDVRWAERGPTPIRPVHGRRFMRPASLRGITFELVTRAQIAARICENDIRCAIHDDHLTGRSEHDARSLDG